MKYKLGNKHPTFNLYQVVALKDFGLVKTGDLGGYVRSEKNLSQDGNAWVFGNAQVSGNAWVSEDAQVSGDAQVLGDAWVSENAQVFGNAWVYGNAQVFGNAQVSENARVSGNAWVSGNARVYGNAQVFGDAKLSKSSDYIHITMRPYNVTITPQNIAIGCQLRSRFETQWNQTDTLATPELIAIYWPLLSVLKKLVKRKHPTKN